MLGDRLPSKLLRSQWDAAAIAAVVLLVFSFLVGGASREHALRLALVELAALPLLVMAAGTMVRREAWREHRLALGIAAGLLAIPLLQLIPLPPSIWTGLPGRSPMATGLDLAGVSPGWNALSLAPELTWRAILALVPPLAMFLAVLVSPPQLTGRLALLLVACAVISLVLGVAQLASGGERLYPWETTSAGSVNGFFANHNHMASLLLASLPIAVVMGAGTLRRRDASQLPLWLAAFFLGFVIVGLAAIRSKAGLILLGPVMAATLLAVWVASGRGRPKAPLLVLAGAIGVALTAVIMFALTPILARFGAEYTEDGRFDRWPLVLDTAQTYLPLGSGIGSFNAVYRSVEPLNQLDPTYFNQAHNEYVEMWLETGWLGAALLIAFAIWFARRTWSAWRSQPSRGTDLQRAASIAIASLMIHSFVDYPLRTTTLAVVFALCCAMLELGNSATASGAGQPRLRRA